MEHINHEIKWIEGELGETGHRRMGGNLFRTFFTSMKFSHKKRV